MAAQPRKQVVSLEHWASNISTEERYTSQTKSDFGAPSAAAPRQGKASKQGGTTIVLGYEPSTTYATESRDQFTEKLSATAELARGGASAPEPGPGFGTADCIHNSLYAPADGDSPFDTEHDKYHWAAGDSAGHRAGLAAIETCRATSLQLNRTRIVLGDAPAEYQTSTETALTGTLAALAASGETLSVPRRRPTCPAESADTAAAGAPPALVPGRLIEIGDGEPAVYETTYAAATVVSADATRAPPFQPGRGSLVIGYEKPEYVTEAMRAMGRTEFKLGEHTVPALVPRYAKDHPVALAAAAARKR